LRTLREQLSTVRDLVRVSRRGRTKLLTPQTEAPAMFARTGEGRRASSSATGLPEALKRPIANFPVNKTIVTTGQVGQKGSSVAGGVARRRRPLAGETWTRRRSCKLEGRVQQSRLRQSHAPQGGWVVPRQKSRAGLRSRSSLLVGSPFPPA
jgi:hypothetical protein